MMTIGIIAALILIAASNFLRGDETDFKMGSFLLVISFLLFCVTCFIGLHDYISWLNS